MLIKEEDAGPSASRASTPASTSRAWWTTPASTQGPTTSATAEPTQAQLDLLRGKIDPFGTVKFDFVSGRDRLAYLKEILDAEWERAAARIA